MTIHVTSAHTGRQSWVAEANNADCGFPLENLPFCIFRVAPDAEPTVGVGIGDQVLDLMAAQNRGLISGHKHLESCVAERALNALFSEGGEHARDLRKQLIELLEEGASEQRLTGACLHRIDKIELGIPFLIGDYTDFLASYNHAFNVGMLYRPHSPVLPNFTSMPIAYHARASSVVASGEPVFRPQGLYRPSHDSLRPIFGPTRRLDYELEFGIFIGKGNIRGTSIAVDDAQAHIAGFCLLNDWSARDIQAWETQPLGPFIGKNFCTTISAWVVTVDALAPYRTALARNDEAEPAFDYLASTSDVHNGALAIHAEVRLLTATMARQGLPAQIISNALLSRDSYWTFAQMIAQHTINGCNLRTGDLLGTGTLSGPAEGTQGCLLELTHGGKQPLVLGNGETRTFLEDGDEVSLIAYCRHGDGPKIGFGECRGKINPKNIAI